jgi:hypothetical protein
MKFLPKRIFAHKTGTNPVTPAPGVEKQTKVYRAVLGSPCVRDVMKFPRYRQRWGTEWRLGAADTDMTEAHDKQSQMRIS